MSLAALALLLAVAAATAGCERVSSLVARRVDSIGREKILLKRHVTHVESSTDGVRVVATDTGSLVQQAVAGKFAVLTIPLYRLNAIQFEPRLSDVLRPRLNLLVHGDSGEGFDTRTVEPDAIRAVLLAAFDELSGASSNRCARTRGR